MEIQHLLKSMASRQSHYLCKFVFVCLCFWIMQINGQDPQHRYIYNSGPNPTPYLPNEGYESYGGENYGGGAYIYNGGDNPAPLSCNQRNSCKGREWLFLEPYDVHEVNCFCDDLCQVYDDCCPDFLQTASNQHYADMKLKRGLFSCRQVNGINGHSSVYVVDSCPKDYPDPFFKKQCEGTAQNVVFSDIPVSSNSSGILFKNFYCATCNGVKDFSFWNVDIDCETHPRIDPQNENLNVEEIITRLLSPTDNDCSLIFKHSTHHERFCKPNIISKCRSDWTDKQIKRKCKASKKTSYRYAYERIFRNEFCAECNYVNASNLDCSDKITPTVGPDGKTEKNTDFTWPFSMLLDMNAGAGRVQESRTGILGKQNTETRVEMRRCQLNHIYDPFADVCRLVRCGTGEKFFNGRCVSDPNYIPMTTTLTTETAEVIVPPSTTPQQPQPTNMPSSTTPPLPNTTTTKHPYKFTIHESNSRTRFFRQPGTVPFVGADMGRNHADTTNTTDVFTDYSSTESTSETPTHSSRNLHSGVEYKILQMKCPVVSIPIEDYTVDSSGRAYIPIYSRYYNTSDYVNDTNGDIMICTPSDERNYSVTYNVTTRVEMFEFDQIQGLVSYIGLLISILCLFVVFVIYMIFPSLRNIGGKCVICLVVALLLAQLSFLLGGPLRDYHLACYILAVSLHYFYLCAFCWMNVLSIDILKIISSATTRSDSLSNCFIYYSLYAWMTPTAIVGTTVLIDFIGDDIPEFQAMYGHGICWITQRWPLLLMFAAPVALILIINIIIFVVTTMKICIASRAARYLHADKKDKTSFLLYVKLCVIMGLTWIFGFVAAFTELSFLWYVFIVFNTLQGAFLCFAFVCTRNVFKLLSGRENKKKKTSATTRVYYNSSNNHGHHIGSNKTKTSVLDTSYNGDARVIESRETSI